MNPAKFRVPVVGLFWVELYAPHGVLFSYNNIKGYPNHHFILKGFILEFYTEWIVTNAVLWLSLPYHSRNVHGSDCSDVTTFYSGSIKSVRPSFFYVYISLMVCYNGIYAISFLQQSNTFDIWSLARWTLKKINISVAVFSLPQSSAMNSALTLLLRIPSSKSLCLVLSSQSLKYTVGDG